jgi:hypothetical protein
VTPPSGASGQTADVTVFNADGQNSTFLQQWPNIPAYNYPATGTPQLQNVSPSSLPAGGEAMVDITALNTSFANRAGDGGFRHFRYHGDRRLGDQPDAPGGQRDSGARRGAGLFGNQRDLRVPGDLAAVRLPDCAGQSGRARELLAVVNGVPGQATIYPNAVATIWGANLANPQIALSPISNANSPAAVGSGSAQIAYSSFDQVNVPIPASTPIGPVDPDA